MKVSALLRTKGPQVVTVTPHATVRDAIRLLAEHRIGALVVSADGTTVAGIISERDIVRHLHSDGGPALDAAVSSAMSSAVVTCGPDDDVAGLMGPMTAGRFRHLPVVAGGSLAGIVSIGDVVKARVDELEDDRRALNDYISAR